MKVSYSYSLNESINNYLKFKNNFCNDKKNLKCNKSRTNLLLLASKELSDLKNNCLITINSKTIRDSEKEYSKQNDYTVVLKREIYSSSSLSSRGEVTQSKSGTGLSNVKKVNSRNSIASFYTNKLSISTQKSIDEKSVGSSQNEEDELNKFNSVVFKESRKTSVSYKKIQFFRQSTLKKLNHDEEPRQVNIIKEVNPSMDKVREKIECISIDCGILKNEKQINRTKNGFKYLRALSRKLKISEKKRRVKNNFATMKEILHLKESLLHRSQEKDIPSIAIPIPKISYRDITKNIIN